MPFMTTKFKPLALLLLVLSVGPWFACRKADVSSKAVAEASQDEKVDDRPIILAFGDSLTEGYGLEKSQSYPALLQKRIDEAGLRYRVVNAGISGDTTSGGLSRIEVALNLGQVEFMVLELGPNDMLRGGDLKLARANLEGMIKAAKAKNVTVILAGMLAPPDRGVEYATEFANIYKELSAKYKLALIPFFLDGVAGKPELNQADGMHPNSQGARIVTENVWKVLEPLVARKK